MLIVHSSSSAGEDNQASGCMRSRINLQGTLPETLPELKLSCLPKKAHVFL
jgi:hypothetical protein